jgi:glycosyltransferase involved in cell wall biosynthesis
MRVLQVVGGLRIGGTEHWLTEMARQCVRCGDHWTFCVFTDSAGVYDEDVVAMGCSIVHCDLSKGVLSFARAFLRALLFHRFDVVHSHVHLFSGLVLALSALVGVRGRVVHAHSARPGARDLTHRLYAILMKALIWWSATAGLAASREAAEALFPRHWDRRERWQVFHCGIDLRVFSKVETCSRHLRRSLGIPETSHVVGHIGRITYEKNHRFFVEIAKALSALDPATRFLVVGDGPLRAAVEHQVEALGLADQFVFTGSRNDVAVLFREVVDLLVFPSRWEGLPLTVIEAQAAGVPALISSAITEEVMIVPEFVRQLPLAVGPVRWAECALDLLNRGKCSPSVALKAISASDFNIQRSAETLGRFYRMCASA